MRTALRPCAQGLYHWRSGRIVRFALVPAHGRVTVPDARKSGGRGCGRGGERRHGAPLARLRELRPVSRLRGPGGPVPGFGGGVMIGTIRGKIREKAALIDPSHYGRSDTIAIGLIAVAAASPAAAQRYSGGNVRFSELYYFWRQLAWIAIGIPVMIAISMMPRERARRISLFGAAFFFVLLIFVPILGPEVNGAKRWINFGLGQVQPSEFLKPFFVVSMAWLLSLKEADKSLPVYPISAV